MQVSTKPLTEKMSQAGSGQGTTSQRSLSHVRRKMWGSEQRTLALVEEGEEAKDRQHEDGGEVEDEARRHGPHDPVGVCHARSISPISTCCDDEDEGRRSTYHFM